MKFSPAYLATLIIIPLKYYFANYAPDDLRWNEDIKLSNIEIGTVNDFHKLAIQAKPRIMINRGDFQIGNTGLTDNLSEASWNDKLKGTTQKINMVLIRGQITIILEARQEGTCEKLVDLVQHFLTWTGPILAEAAKFKLFGLPLTVSSVIVNKEDTELFQAAISVPYVKEEHWSVNNDGGEFRSFIFSLVKL